MHFVCSSLLWQLATRPIVSLQEIFNKRHMPNVLDGVNLFHITTEPIVPVSVNLMGMETVCVIGPLRLIHSKRLGCNPFCPSQCRWKRYGLFTLPGPDSDSDSDSDSKPYGYIVLFRTFQIRIWIPTQMVSQMVTHFRDRSLSLLHTFQSEDQSLNLNQCEISA